MYLPQNMEVVKEYGTLWIKGRREVINVEKQDQKLEIGKYYFLYVP